MPHDALVDEYRKHKENHRCTLVQRTAKLVLGNSVIRVFEPGTSRDIRPALVELDVSQLPLLEGQERFRWWFERALDRVEEAILLRNAGNPRIQPGLRWGHGTKVLTLFLRELVLSSRYFTDREAKRIAPWLYTPLDRVALNRLAALGHPNGIFAIKDIDSAEAFYRIQDDLGEAAAKVGVPRIWFDDVWAE